MQWSHSLFAVDSSHHAVIFNRTGDVDPNTIYTEVDYIFG